jgi:hypothetical protein
LFLQRRQSIVSGINEATIIQTRTLPQEADVSSTNLGIGYEFSNTDYRFNPRKGNEFAISSTAGTKKIRKNNQILDLKDPSEPDFKFEHLSSAFCSVRQTKCNQVRIECRHLSKR